MKKIIVKDNNIIVEIYVKPNSKKDKIFVEKEGIHVQIKDPPAKGKANKSIIQFLSKFFHISKNQVSIIGGTKSKSKRLLFSDLNEEQKNRIMQTLDK